MTDAIEKLAEVIGKNISQSPRGIGYAVLAALPDLVKPLEWEGFRSGPYHIEVEKGGIAKLFCNSERDEDGGIDCMRGGYLTLVSIEDLKADADAHHRAQIMQAFGVEP